MNYQKVAEPSEGDQDFILENMFDGVCFRILPTYRKKGVATQWEHGKKYFKQENTRKLTRYARQYFQDVEHNESVPAL